MAFALCITVPVPRLSLQPALRTSGLLQLCVGRGTGCGMHIRFLDRLQTLCQSQRAVWEAGRWVGERRALASRSASGPCSSAEGPRLQTTTQPHPTASVHMKL